MLCIMGWGDVKKKIKGEINKSHSMKSTTSDRHQSNVWPKTFHSASLKGFTACMIVHRGAEKSTPYDGNDPEKTWYRIPSLRRDREGLYETTSLHQETNWDWTSTIKQKSWQMREDAHGPEQYSVPHSSRNLGFYPHSHCLVSICPESTREGAGHTHISLQGWFPTEGLLHQIYVYILKT